MGYWGNWDKPNAHLARETSMEGILQMADRRQAPRFEIDWAVDYKTITVNLEENEVYESNTIDISRKGLAFIAEEPLPDGSIIAFALYSPVFDQPSLAIGRVRWQKRIGRLSVVGVQWIEWEDYAQLNPILECASGMKNEE